MNDRIVPLEFTRERGRIGYIDSYCADSLVLPNTFGMTAQGGNVVSAVQCFGEYLEPDEACGSDKSNAHEPTLTGGLSRRPLATIRDRDP